MPNPNSRPKVFVVPAMPGKESLAVLIMKSLTNATNGVEYFPGQVYGFDAESAVSIVTHESGKGWCHDVEAGERWLAALMPLHDAGKLSTTGMLDLLDGPPVRKMKADKAALHDAMEAADEKLTADDEAAKAKAEDEAKALAAQQEAEARAEAERLAEAKRTQAELDAQHTANNNANERRAEPVDASRTVSSANVSNDALDAGTPPKPTPPQKPGSTRRGR